MKTTKNSLLLLIVATLLIAPFSWCMEPDTCQKVERKPIVLFVDLDNVLTKNQKPKITDVNLLKILIAHPLGIMYGLWDYEKLRDKGMEFAQQHNEIESIIDNMIKYLQQEGYGDFSTFKNSLLKITILPQPIEGMVKLLHSFKDEGYILIGATNQNYKLNMIYRRKLEEQGINICELFDAILTTYSDDVKISKKPKPEKSTSIDMHNRIYIDKRTYMAAQSIQKPDASYFEILKALAKKFGAYEYHFIDDQDENVKAACECGIHGIQFDLPIDKNGKRINARKASQQELDHAVNCVIMNLKSKGISI